MYSNIWSPPLIRPTADWTNVVLNNPRFSCVHCEPLDLVVHWPPLDLVVHRQPLDLVVQWTIHDHSATPMTLKAKLGCLGCVWAWSGHPHSKPSKTLCFSNIFDQKYWKTFNFPIFSNIFQYFPIFIKVFQFSNILGGLGLGRGLVSRAGWVENLQKHWKIGKP